MNSNSIQSCIVAITCSIFHVSGMESARADYNSYGVLTVEWLVDNSDTILIAREDGEEGTESVVEVIKGDGSSFEGKLPEASAEQMGLSRGSFRQPPQSGKFKLHFIKQGARLQSVGLGRDVRMERELHLGSIWYGVTQFEQVFLDPSSFLQAIRQRVRSRPSEEQVESMKGRKQPTLSVQASVNFPFETTDELFGLVVPRTHEWRDHYLQVLSSGDAIQRMDAITKLKAFADLRSRDAIQAAADSTEDVPIGYRQDWMSSNASRVITAKDVRAHAQAVSGQ